MNSNIFIFCIPAAILAAIGGVFVKFSALVAVALIVGLYLLFILIRKPNPNRLVRPAPKVNENLNRWNDKLPKDQQKFFRITKIVVPSEEDKRQLLLASEYIHDLDVDTDVMAINYLAHLYTNPDIIVVET